VATAHHLAGRPPRILRGRPIVSYAIDPYLVGTVGVAIAALVIVLQLPLLGAVIGSAIIAGWSSAWSP